MPRIGHGELISLTKVEEARDAVADVLASIAAPTTLAPVTDMSRFDFLFPTLQDNPDSRLPDGPETVAALKALGLSMRDSIVPPATQPGQPGDGDSPIPALYTYFGQFVDHDITLEAASDGLLGGFANLFAPDLLPLPLDKIRNELKNTRSATLDLDSVYGAPAPRDGDKMDVGMVSILKGSGPILRPNGKDDFNDLPREGRSPVFAEDRAAKIGDPRNDENTIVAQLHTAFLRAHNAIVSQGNNFEQARSLLRQHYQQIVVEDFLKRIAAPDIVQNILDNGNQVYRPYQGFFMPFEFSGAAYRFGHSMVRTTYNFNLNFNSANLGLLFTFSALSGNLGFLNPGGGLSPHHQGTATLPENWIIEWERFAIEGQNTNFARRIDTKLVEPLFDLRELTGAPIKVATDPASAHKASLAVRNLLRGYLQRQPTGQAVAQALGQDPLTAAEIRIVAEQAGGGQVEALEAVGMLERTPLWYYILAEAAHGGGQHLGPVGSTIVAEVLIELVRRSEDSYLRIADWKPSLPSADANVFRLPDLLRLAGVLA